MRIVFRLDLLESPPRTKAIGGGGLGHGGILGNVMF